MDTGSIVNSFLKPGLCNPCRGSTCDEALVDPSRQSGSRICSQTTGYTKNKIFCKMVQRKPKQIKCMVFISVISLVDNFYFFTFINQITRSRMILYFQINT